MRSVTYFLSSETESCVLSGMIQRQRIFIFRFMVICMKIVDKFK